VRFGYIAPLGFGLLLLYVGVFGLRGFGLSASFSLNAASLPAKEQFQELNGWNPMSTGSAVAPYISAVGPSDNSSVVLDASRGGLSQVSHGITSLVTAMQWTASMYAKGTLLQMQFWGTTYKVWVQVWAGGELTGSDGTGLGSVDSNWHLYSMEVTVSGTDAYSNYHASASFYLDGVLKGTFSSVGNDAVNWSPVIVLAANSGGVGTVDFLDLESGLLTGAQLQALIPGTTPTSPTTGSLAVTCTKGGSGLEGVTVTLTSAGGTSAGPYTAISDATGKATISNIQAGSYHVAAEESGYILQSTPPDPLNIQTGSPTTLSLVFAFSSETGTVRVSCSTVNNVPVAEAIISLVGSTGNAMGQSYLAHSDATGTAVLTVLTGTYHVHVAKTGYPDPTVSPDSNSLLTVSASSTAGASAIFSSDTSPSPSPGSSPSPSPSPGSSPSPSPSQNPSPSPSGNQNPVPTINFNIDWNGIWKNVNALVDANRQPLLAIGGLIALFSFIGLMLPAKRLRVSF
jgi:hypothetical protein